MIFIYILISIIFVLILLDFVVRLIAQKGIKTDFYGSIKRDEVNLFQQKFGIKTSSGRGWTHFAWVADPLKETYQIERLDDRDQWKIVGLASYGSWLTDIVSGIYRVLAVEKDSGTLRNLGEVTLSIPDNSEESQPFAIPRISGEWHTLFKPEKTGDYINDHCIFQDRNGNWRLLGITSHSDGDYRKERSFASGTGNEFPPLNTFTEEMPIADFDELAWAPDVIEQAGKYHLFWSPHQLYHMTSDDGENWVGHEIVMDKPFHKFFRDAKIFQVAPDQWLLYATGRGRWFSRIDIYQSFDLVHWQYIRPAIRCGWGSEKNFVTGSMESHFLIEREGNYYLSTTYNNESFFLSALLLQIGRFLNKKDYNNTLVFGSRNPYDFGIYRGRTRTPNMVARFKAHAPVYIHSEGKWFLTTCGWPFAASITNGEVAWAELSWDT